MIQRSRGGAALQRMRACFSVDLRFNLRRVSLWALLAVLGLMALQISRGEGRLEAGAATVGGAGTVTSEFAVAKLLAILVPIAYTFFIVVYAGMSIIRDEEHRVGELVHATALRAWEYAWSKYFAVLATFLGVLALHLALMVLIHHGLPHEANLRLGPFRALSYVRPAVVFALPLIVFLSGATFAVGGRFRSPIAVFVLPVVLLPAWIAIISWSPGWLDPRINRWLMLADPSGLRWLLETWFKNDRGSDFYDHAPITYAGGFLLSRLAWAALGVLAVAASARDLGRRLRGLRPARARQRFEAMPRSAAPPLVAQLGALGMRSRGVGIRAFAEVAAAELKELRKRASLYLFIPLIVIQTVGGTLKDLGAFDTLVLRTPGTMAMRSLTSLSTLGCLLLLFLVVESMERERLVRLDEIFLATPVSDAAIVLGKALAGVAVALILIAITFVAAMVALLAQGRVGLDPWPLVVVWGGLLLPTFVLFVSFVVAVEAIGGNRFATYGAGIGALVLTTYLHVTGRMSWATNWNVLYALRWSDMGAFDVDGWALLLNRLQALAVAAFLLALAVVVYHRRKRDRAHRRAWLRSLFLGEPARRWLPLILPPVALTSTLAVLGHRGFQGAPARRVERAYRTENRAAWKDAPLPALSRVELDLELDPAAHAFSVTGVYELTNESAAPLAVIPLTLGAHFRDPRFTLDGKPASVELRAGLALLRPDQPLAPGGHLRAGFALTGRLPDGASRDGGDLEEFVLSGGVHLHSLYRPSFVPLLGFRDDLGLDEDEHPEEAGVRAASTSVIPGVVRPFSTRIRIVGPAAYTYNSVGVAVEDRVRDGRREVIWESDHPVSMFNVVAGRWDVRRRDSNAVFCHSRHCFNVEPMLQAMAEGRHFYGQWFGAYPWRELRLSEFPDHARFAEGTATNIAFSEGHGFLSKGEPESNPGFWITAHEVAHQWWGNLVVPRAAPGSEVLAEGMAHFSALLLVEQVRGARERMEFARRIEERYGSSRRVDVERPLTQIGTRPDDRTVAYDRGSWALWMLLDGVGREPTLEGLRDFLRRYADAGEHPTLQDLLAMLRERATDRTRFDALVEAWFNTVTLPEYRLVDPTRRANPGTSDAWVASAQVRNAGTGRFEVEVAASSGERFDDAGRPSPDYHEARTKVVVGAGEAQAVSLRCDFRPDRMVVDPDVRILQLNRNDATARF